MSFQFRPATRTSAIPLIGVYGESGTGKTYSSLLLARGLVGPKGRIAMVDTESGRGELYADVIPGGYQVASLGEPFSPERYIEAITAAERVSDVILVDSVSHEWEGIGGVLEMAGEIEKSSGKPGLHCWKAPKMAHQRFVMKLLGSRVPIILCMRAKHKSRQVKNEKGRSEIVKDDNTTPIQADDFIFEMTAHFETLKTRLPTGKDHHYIRVTKCSHPKLRPCFPEDGPITIETGAAIASWARDGKAPPAAASTDPQFDAWEAAKGAAEHGTETFKTFWNGPGKAHRETLRPRIGELKGIAEKADRELSNPFAETSGEATNAPPNLDMFPGDLPEGESLAR